MNENNRELIVEQEIDIPDDDDALEKVKELLLFRKVVQVSDNTLQLDNGVMLEILPNQGSCPGCCSGDYEITELNTCDNAITNVELACEEIDDLTSYNDQSYLIYVYAEDRRIKILQVDGTDGTGHYGTGYWIVVKREKMPGEIILNYNWSHLSEIYTRAELETLEHNCKYAAYLTIPGDAANVRENVQFMLQYFEKESVLRLLCGYANSFRLQDTFFADRITTLEKIFGEEWKRIVLAELEEAEHNRPVGRGLMAMLTQAPFMEWEWERTVRRVYEKLDEAFIQELQKRYENGDVDDDFSTSELNALYVFFQKQREGLTDG